MCVGQVRPLWYSYLDLFQLEIFRRDVFPKLIVMLANIAGAGPNGLREPSSMVVCHCSTAVRRRGGG